MNIRPVSFGRTIRVNAPLNVAKRMAELVNQNRSVEEREERSSQQKLKALFYDANIGSAQALELDKKSYIVTGDESQAVSDLLLDRGIHIGLAKNAYGEGEMFELAKDEEDKRCNEYLSLIVANSVEPMSIYAKYADVPKGKELDSVGTRVKIKSINVVL